MKSNILLLFRITCVVYAGLSNGYYLRCVRLCGNVVWGSLQGLVRSGLPKILKVNQLINKNYISCMKSNILLLFRISLCCLRWFVKWILFEMCQVVWKCCMGSLQGLVRSGRSKILKVNQLINKSNLNFWLNFLVYFLLIYSFFTIVIINTLLCRQNSLKKKIIIMFQK